VIDDRPRHVFLKFLVNLPDELLALFAVTLAADVFAPIPDLPSLATKRGGFDPRVPRFPHEACFCLLSTKETGPAGRTE
jgi:hypothetical protein